MSEKVKCMICGEKFRSVSQHLAAHGKTVDWYRRKFPNAKLVSDDSSRVRKEARAKQIITKEHKKNIGTGVRKAYKADPSPWKNNKGTSGAVTKRNNEMVKNGTHQFILHPEIGLKGSKKAAEIAKAHPEETSEKMSRLSNIAWSDPKHRKMMEEVLINNNLNMRLKTPTKPQIYLYDIIKSTCRLKAKLEYRVDCNNHSFLLDVAIPSAKLGFEFDGVYWHEGKENHDKYRDRLLKNKGWKILHYNEDDDIEDKVLRDLHRLINSNKISSNILRK